MKEKLIFIFFHAKIIFSIVCRKTFSHESTSTQNSFTFHAHSQLTSSPDVTSISVTHFPSVFLHKSSQHFSHRNSSVVGVLAPWQREKLISRVFLLISPYPQLPQLIQNFKFLRSKRRAVVNYISFGIFFSISKNRDNMSILKQDSDNKSDKNVGIISMQDFLQFLKVCEKWKKKFCV